MKEIKVGMVGAGYVCAHHIRAVRDLGFARVVGVCDVNEERARQTAAKFGIEGVYRSLKEMAAAGPDVIHVLTPPQSHCALTLEALDMGCHVFVEKPMAESAEECDRMIAKAREKGLRLSVNHSARMEPTILRAHDLIRQGAIGDVLSVHFFRGSDYPPYAGGPLPPVYRQGSYPFRDLGVHGLYVLESFLGESRDMDIRYYASGREPNLTFDEWRANLECERGTGHMFISWNMKPIQNEFWIHGARGYLHIDCFLQTCHLYRVWPAPKQIQFVLNGFLNGLRRAWQVPMSVVRFLTGSLKPSPGIYRSVQDFHRALHDGKEPPISAEEGRRTIAVLERVVAKPDEEKEERLRHEIEKPLPPARILVTGAAGFLGSALMRQLLARGEQPRLLLRKPAAKGSPIATLPARYGSLGQPDLVDRAVEGVEVVYHVGATMKGWREDYEQGTIWGTRNIIDACIKHKVKRLIYVSSMSVLDNVGHKTGTPSTEDSPYEPYPERRGLYTQSKCQAERMVLEAARDRGLRVVVVRPGQIFGPGAERVTPNGVIGIAGQWIVAGSGKRNLPVVYVDDVVDAMIAAETAPGALGKVIQIVDPEKINQNEYLKAVKAALPEIPVRRVPVWFLVLAGFGFEVLGKLLKMGMPLTRYKVRALNPIWPVDISRARTLMNWSPKVGVREGLRRTYPPKVS